MGLDLSKNGKRAKEKAKAGSTKVPGAGKVKKLLGDFNSAIPVLREHGYQLSDVTLKLGIPPSMVATFEFTREVSDEELAEVLRENKGRKLLSMLIRMLSTARKFQSGVKVAGLKAQSTAVEIGILGTGVAIKFA